MDGPRLIVCATDLREGGDLAIMEADAWARRHNAAIAFVHAIPETSRSHVLFPHLTQRTIGLMPSITRLAAEAVAGRVERLTARPQADLDVRVEVGSPAGIIVSVAEEMGADLIIVGAASSPSPNGPLGSVALRVVRHAHSPVLVMRSTEHAGPVLAASDLSDPAFPAIRAGAFLGRSLGADLSVIHVAELPLPMPVTPEAVGVGLGYAMTGAEYQLFRGAARETLASAMTRLGLNAQTLLEDGIPSVSVVSAARRLEARLLVIGTEGRTGLRRMLLGSTAEQILGDSPCSVLVVRLHSHGVPS
jgi:universal stress protein E